MRKIFVLDTSALVYDPRAFENFKGNDVVIPIFVLNELDNLKKFPNEAGKNARIAVRLLDELSNQGDVCLGIKIKNDILLKIDVSLYQNVDGDPNYGDNKILSCAYNLQKTFASQKVILVSKDINLRVRARAFGLTAQDYEKDKVRYQELYTGLQEICNTEAGNELLKNEIVQTDKYGIEAFQNQFILFIDENGKAITSGRNIDGVIQKVESHSPWGLNLLNKEQLYAADLLLDPALPLVTLTGFAGTGKSLVSLACCLDLLITKKKYDHLLVYRPIVSVGNELGYLPGSLDDKLDPYMTPIKDAFEFLLSPRNKNWRDKLGQYEDKVSMEAISFIRGRSIPNALMLIDEAQNLSPAEAKTILTRAGNGTKIIMNGDIAQIDNSNLDAANNGLVYVIEKFKDYDIAGHMTLTKGERSPLATLASEIL